MATVHFRPSRTAGYDSDVEKDVEQDVEKVRATRSQMDPDEERAHDAGTRCARATLIIVPLILFIWAVADDILRPEDAELFDMGNQTGISGSPLDASSLMAGLVSLEIGDPPSRHKKLSRLEKRAEKKKAEENEVEEKSEKEKEKEERPRSSRSRHEEDRPRSARHEDDSRPRRTRREEETEDERPRKSRSARRHRDDEEEDDVSERSTERSRRRGLSAHHHSGIRRGHLSRHLFRHRGNDDWPIKGVEAARRLHGHLHGIFSFTSSRTGLQFSVTSLRQAVGDCYLALNVLLRSLGTRSLVRGKGASGFSQWLECRVDDCVLGP
eukprot:823030-Prorocentrum_minimum.AAC.1